MDDDHDAHDVQVDEPLYDEHELLVHDEVVHDDIMNDLPQQTDVQRQHVYDEIDDVDQILYVL